MKKIFTLFSVMLVAMSLQAGELTVADGSATHEKLPVYPYYGDVSGVRSQVIFPASYLESLQGGTITSITFYTGTQAKMAMTTVYTVSLAVVEQSEFASASYLNVESTVVYEGTIDASQATVTLELTTPFTYEEGNLFLDIQTKAKGNYDDASFLGINGSTNTAIYYSTYGSLLAAFLPKTTFVFDEPSGSTCARPSKLTAEATPDGGVFSWQGEENSQYQVCVVATGEEAAGWKLLEANGFAYTAKGLTAGTTYDFYVRTYCSESEQSSAIKATFTPVCDAPAKVELSELTHNTATLTWSAVAGISKYQYLCLPADSTPNWEDVKEVETLTATIDTLQPSTTYDFYVRSYFNAETQSEATKVSFTTNCVAEALPYVETFDKSTSLPSCWEASNVSNAKWQMYTYGDEGKSGYCLQFSSRSGATATLKTPAIELSEKALLKFYWKNSSAISVKLQISTNGGSTKTDIDTDLSSTQSTLVQKTIDLSEYAGETVTLYFVASNSTSSNKYIYMDTLSVTAKPCELPKQLKADASSTGAVVTWVAGSDEAEWNLRYRAVGDEDWKEVKELAEPSYTLSGLVSGTEYEVQVQSSCSTDKQSGWTTSAIFTPQCPVPSNLRVSQITDTEALVTWDGTEATYNLQYREKNTEAWTTISAIEGKETLLNELSGSTSYEVQVQSACEGAFSSVKTFTTACAPLSNAIPFAEDFEEVEEGSLPSCWTRRTVSEYPMVMSTKGAYGIKEDSDSTAHCLVFHGEGEQVVILPAFDAPLNARALAFYYKVSSSAVEVEVGYLPHLYGTFQIIKALDNTVYAYAEPATEVVLNELPEDAKYLAIRYTSTSQWSNSHFDNISIADPSPTGMENIHTTGKALKRIENGMLILEYNGTKFDATGKKVYTK